MSDSHQTPAVDLDALVRLHDLVPVPPDSLARVRKLLDEHREAMRRFASAGIETRDVFPAQVFRA